MKEANRPAASSEARTLLAQAPIRFAQYPQSRNDEPRVAVDDRASERAQAPTAAPPIRIARRARRPPGDHLRRPSGAGYVRRTDAKDGTTQDFEVFHLKYASAYWTALQLEDFFEDAKDDKRRSRFTYYFYDYYNQDNDDKKRLGLDERPKLKFISETDTNTIIVRNATEDQLATMHN